MYPPYFQAPQQFWYPPPPPNLQFFAPAVQYVNYPMEYDNIMYAPHEQQFADGAPHCNTFTPFQNEFYHYQNAYAPQPEEYNRFGGINHHDAAAMFQEPANPSPNFAFPSNVIYNDDSLYHANEFPFANELVQPTVSPASPQRTPIAPRPAVRIEPPQVYTQQQTFIDLPRVETLSSPGSGGGGVASGPLLGPSPSSCAPSPLTSKGSTYGSIGQNRGGSAGKSSGAGGSGGERKGWSLF
ncbi:hypothetical protein HDU98_009287 [Podochytrium sp. JEL0797]|nr:hypothetical protein HDU98_009287 [Podochytrium sp. JEL0797]